MTSAASSPDLLVLHGMRVLGGPTLVGLADLFDLDYAAVNELLLDAQACGWAAKLDFFGTTTSVPRRRSDWRPTTVPTLPGTGESSTI